MNKAGGIIATVAGVFGVIAAIVTLTVGGLGSAFKADNANTVIGLGWGGIVFSFLVIVFGAVALYKPKGAGIGLIVCSIGGAILGGTIVAVFMVLSLIGGIVCVIGGRQKKDTNSAVQQLPEGAPGPPAVEMYSQLEKLADLKAKGVLTEEEFQTQKTKLLSGSQASHAVADHPAPVEHVRVPAEVPVPRPKRRRLVISIALAALLLVFAAYHFIRGWNNPEEILGRSGSTASNPAPAAVKMDGAATAPTGADNPTPASIQGLLPPSEAQIIETKDLGSSAGHARSLVLWMLQPEKVLAAGSCADSVYGDHWYGPTRLSLIDLAQPKIINTIEVHSPNEGPNESEHKFPVPYYVSNGYYYVPQVDAQNGGSPNILNLSDLTGEGVLGQFVLFEYAACGVAETAVLGYSRTLDAAVQYRIEISGTDEKPAEVSWADHTFGEKPKRPGYWSFVWDAGHGSNSLTREEVSFDSSRQIFVDKQQSVPKR